MTTGPTVIFKCPHCDEPLRVLARGAGAGQWVVMAFALVVAFEGRFGWPALMATLLAVPVGIALANLLLGKLLGYDVEPVGRVSLGGFGD